MAVDTADVVRLLTGVSLVGLLLAVGLRLTVARVTGALRGSRLGWILAANFVLVPLLAIGLARAAGVSEPVAAGMLLLAAAPFGPVVAVFARMARADLALAAGLTGLFPFVSSFLTPIVCAASLELFGGTGELDFPFLSILLVLTSTITLPLGAGVALRHALPAFSAKLLRPVEVASETTGLISLGFVTIVELPEIIDIGWRALLAMFVLSEVSLALGYALGGPSPASRRVIALGTSNRNIALAILLALGSFPGTRVVGAVVANGLLLIFLGLVHVALWRFAARMQSSRAEAEYVATAARSSPDLARARVPAADLLDQLSPALPRPAARQDADRPESRPAERGRIPR